MSDFHQPPLFIEDVRTALSDVVRALGGFKKVGAELRPDKAADEAGRCRIEANRFFEDGRLELVCDLVGLNYEYAQEVVKKIRGA